MPKGRPAKKTKTAPKKQSGAKSGKAAGGKAVVGKAVVAPIIPRGSITPTLSLAKRLQKQSNGGNISNGHIAVGYN